MRHKENKKAKNASHDFAESINILDNNSIQRIWMADGTTNCNLDNEQRMDEKNHV